MAAAVATPLEKQFSTIAGVDQMTSSSTQGTTQVTLQFALDRDIDAAAQDVQTAISLARRQLPADMSIPPSYRKVNPADMPIFYLAVTSGHAAAVSGQRIRRDPDGAAHLDGERGGAGAGLRLASLCGARAGGSAGPRRPAHRHRRSRAGAGTGQPQPAHRNAAGPAPFRLRHDQRAAAECSGLQRRDRGLPQRRAGAGQGHRPGDRRRAEQPHGRLVQRQARHRPGDPAPARHQHRPGGRRDPQAAAAVPGADPAGHRRRSAVRPLGGHPRRRCTRCSSRWCWRSCW